MKEEEGNGFVRADVTDVKDGSKKEDLSASVAEGRRF
jgi:hypothetical protein